MGVEWPGASGRQRQEGLPGAAAGSTDRTCSRRGFVFIALGPPLEPQAEMEFGRHSPAALEVEPGPREIELDPEQLPLVPDGAASHQQGGGGGPAAALDAARPSSPSTSALLAFTLISSLGGFLFGQ